MSVGFLGLVDPIIFGAASTGIIGVINQGLPDISFAFCANRAGVTSKEVMDYDPRLALLPNNKSSITVYVSEGDDLVDVPLAQHMIDKYMPTVEVRCVVDRTKGGFHGRWLYALPVHMLCCKNKHTRRCLNVLVEGLQQQRA